jgi:hypothetical protein
MIEVNDDLGGVIQIDPLTLQTLDYFMVPDGGLLVKILEEHTFVKCSYNSCNETAEFLLYGVFYNEANKDIVCFNCLEHKELVVSQAKKRTSLSRIH